MKSLEILSVVRRNITQTEFPEVIEFDQKYMVNGSAMTASEAPPLLTLDELETAKERGDELYWLDTPNDEKAGYYWIEHKTDCIFLSAIVISSSHRNKGIGREVLKWVDQAAGIKKVTKCRLAVGPGNTPALHLYLSEGYRIVDTNPNYFGSTSPNKVRLILEKDV